MPRRSCRFRRPGPRFPKLPALANDASLLLDVTRLVWRRWSGRHPTGIDRVCLAYLERFADDAQAVVQHRRFRRILDRHSSNELFDLLQEPPERFRTKLASRAIRRLGGAPCNSRGRLYLNIGHTGLDSDGFQHWARRSGVRPVYFVHDLIPVTHPQFCRPGEAERHRRRMRAVLSTGAGVIGNSQATLDELEAFARSEGLGLPPSIAAWLGTDTVEVDGAASTAPHPSTFVILGTIEARKNHILLLKIWPRLIEQMGDAAPRLQVIGQRGWEADQVFRMLDEVGGFKGHVAELNQCSDQEVAQYLAGARALLFPSEAEGYGLPLVEALARGVPVIASDLPVFREVGQGVPMLLDPADQAAWEAAILDFSQPMSVTREAQLRRVGSFRAPTWDDHFRAVEDWLATIG